MSISNKYNKPNLNKTNYYDTSKGLNRKQVISSDPLFIHV